MESIDEFQVKLQQIFEQAGHDVEDLEGYECYGKANDCWPFSGLGIYFTKFASHAERREFFDQILPHIAILAGNMIRHLNDGKNSLEQQANDLEVNYHAVAGLLSCGFLCVFPLSRNGTFARSHNFAEYFGKFHRQSDQVDLASRLRCVLQYFRTLSVRDNLWYTSKAIKFTKKEIHYDQLPDMETWLLNQSPLCPVKVNCKDDIIDAAGNVIELNFVSHYLEEGCQIKEDYEKNSLNELLYPELLVAEWILQDVRANEAVIVKRDDWDNIHVAVTGVGIHPNHGHNVRRNTCNELNRTWVGLSSCSCTTKFNEWIQASDDNLKDTNNVYIAKNDASGELTEDPHDMLYMPVTNERNEICTNSIAEQKTFVNHYCELLSKSIVNHAIENASWKLQLHKECNSAAAADVRDEQTPHSLYIDPSYQRDERLVTARSKDYNNNPHCRPFKSVSSSAEYTYGDLLIKSLMSSINGAVSLTSDITALVSDQRICGSLQSGKRLRNQLDITKFVQERHTSVSNISDLADESEKLSHVRPTINSQSQEINGDFPDDTNNAVSNAPETIQKQCSWIETMAFSIAQAIMQSAVILASKCLSPGTKNMSSNTISTDFGQIKQMPSPEMHNLPVLNTYMDSSSIVTVGSTDDMKWSADKINVVSKNSRERETSDKTGDFTMATTRGFHENDSTKAAFDKSGAPLHSRHYSAARVFAETMSNRILCDVLECQCSMPPRVNEAAENEKHVLAHDTSRHIPAEEDVQLQMTMQWIVASAIGCPCLIYYAKEEMGSKKITWISDRAQKNGWLVSDIVECILEYYQTKFKNRSHNQPQLFDFLQSMMNEPKR